jgi:hypothetical protein
MPDTINTKGITNTVNSIKTSNSIIKIEKMAADASAAIANSIFHLDAEITKIASKSASLIPPTGDPASMAAWAAILITTVLTPMITQNGATNTLQKAEKVLQGARITTALDDARVRLANTTPSIPPLPTVPPLPTIPPLPPYP